MKLRHRLFTAITLGLLGTACLSPDDERQDLGTDAGADATVAEDARVSDAQEDAGPVDAIEIDAESSDLASPDAASPDGAALVVNVLNAADDPFATGTGALALFGADRFVASTATTVVVYGLTDGLGDPSYVPLVLTSTQFGGNATGSIALHSNAGDQLAFFLPTGAPQVGLIDLEAPGAVVTESVLASALGSGFSADLEVEDDYLYVSDAPFGADSVVRRYGLAGFSGVGNLSEDVPRRFTLPTEDLDGDQLEDVLVAGRLAFSADGTIGFVAFTVLGNSAPALAGGVFAFDPSTGSELGRVLVPTAGSSTIAQGFVSGFAVTGTHVLVVTAEKQFVPSFTELGGHLSVYEIASTSPFAVEDADASAAYHQPAQRLATSDDNPVGLAVLEQVVLVVNAPYFLDGTLDVFELGTSLVLRGSLPLGGLYRTGYAVPADPLLIAGTSTFLFATEAGTLRFEIEPR